MFDTPQVIENIICYVCKKTALTQCIFCELCNTWIHKSCIKMTAKTFKSLSESPLPFFCSICTSSILPFTTITNKVFSDINSVKKPQLKTLKCFSCSKTIRSNQKEIFCTLGKHSYHQSCLNLKRNEVNKLNKSWSCNSCNSFPFQELNDKDLITQTFNSLSVTYEIKQLIHTDDYDNYIKNTPNLFLDNINMSDEQNEINVNFGYYHLNKLLKTFQNQPNGNLTLFHTNIRSINKHIDELSCLNKLTGYFDIIGLSELWEPENSKYERTYTLPGYHTLQHLRGKTQNSGCGIFVKDNIRYKVRDDLNCSFFSDKEEFQIFFLELFLESENLVVCTLYRHPRGDFTEFQNHLIKAIKKISKQNKKLAVMGDFNIDLLNSTKHQNTEDFLNLMLENLMMPSIIGPTRINDNDKYTLIDNIFFSDFDSIDCSGNLLCPITDHLPNFLRLNLKTTDNNDRTILRRDFSKYNPVLIKHELENMNILPKLLNCNTVDEKYNLLHEKLSLVIDKYAPMKEVKPHNNYDL